MNRQHQHGIGKFVRLSLEQLMLRSIASVLGKASLEGAGKKFDAGDIKALIKARLEATTQVRKTRIDYLDAVKAERQALDQTEADLALVRAALLLKFCADSQVLSDLGLAPRKERKRLSSEELAKAAAKAKATRKGRTAPSPEVIPPDPITPPVVVNGAGRG